LSGTPSAHAAAASRGEPVVRHARAPDRVTPHPIKEVKESHDGPNGSTTTLTPLPSLDHLVGDPGQVAKVPREVVAAIYPQVAVLEAQLRSRLLAEPVTAPMPTKAALDEWISEAAVIARFGLDATWLKRHRTALRQRRIISGSRKKRVYHPRRMAVFLEAQAGR
jgi:hypothetical protein